MPTFSRKMVIAAPSAALFALTQDYDQRLTWDPFLKEARLVNGATAAGVQVRAWCVAKIGPGMETEYVSFNPPHAVAIRMTRGPWLLEQFAGTWRFRELGSEQTEVEFIYHITARPAVLRPLLHRLMLPIFAHEMQGRLKALKHAAEHTPLLMRYREAAYA